MMKLENSYEVCVEGNPLAVKRNYLFRMAVIGDLHVGAQHAIFPRNFGFELNEAQLKLWEYMDSFIKEMKENKVNMLLVVGDLVAGQNWAECGRWLMTGGMQWRPQAAACAKVLEYICKEADIEQIFIWTGTPYHGAKDFSIEEEISLRLHELCPKLQVNFVGEYSFIILRHKTDGVEYQKVMWITHPTTGAIVYPETAVGRDIMFWLNAYAENKIKYKPDIIIRAHGHYSMEVHKMSVRYIQLPCWEAFVPYDKALKFYAKFQPDIGGYIMMFDENLRLSAWHFIYPSISLDTNVIRMTYNPPPLPVFRDVCPQCQEPNPMSRGIQWHCRKCGKYWKKG